MKFLRNEPPKLWEEYETKIGYCSQTHIGKSKFTKIHVSLTLSSLYREWKYANLSSIGDCDE